MSDVKVKFGADDSSLTSSFKKIGVQLAALTAGFLAIGKVAADFQKAIDMGGRLNDLSARTGETAGKLMILERAFENAGAGADAVGATLNKLQRFMVQSGEEGSKQQRIMEWLGLSYDELKNKTPTEQMQEFAKRIQSIQDPSERTTVAMEVLGRSGGELMPLFRAMGTELETAKKQLGSAPAIMDKYNQSLDTIGDAMGAVRQKSVEFALGLLTELSPGLEDIVVKLSQIDAAGIGEKFSEYAKKAIEWASNATGVGKAIESIKLAFDSILAGGIGDGLSLIWINMKIVAMNTVNEIFGKASAALQTFGQLMQVVFADDSATMKFLKSSFVVLSNFIASKMGEALLAVIPHTKMFQGTIEEMQKNLTALSNVEFHNMRVLRQDAKAAGEEILDIAKQAPEVFGENVKKNANKPLFDMTETLKEAEDTTKKIAENLGKAGENAANVKVPEAPRPTEAPTPAPTGALSNALASGGGGGGGSSAAPRERQASRQETRALSRLDSRIADAESRGAFGQADSLAKQRESRLQNMRERQAQREMSGGAATLSPEEMARREGKSDLKERGIFGGGDEKSEVEKRADEIRDEIKKRAGGGDGTEQQKEGEKPKRKGESTDPMSAIEKAVTEIQKLVAKIEPKLPTAALA
jgi:hypothetical protein